VIDEVVSSGRAAPVVASRPRVLIVDDDASARKTTHAMLLPELFELHVAEGGAEALRTLTSHAIDLVICDVMMPEVDGFAVCRAMRHHAAWRSIPIILLTASNESRDVIRGMEAGADQFVCKPIEGQVLRARARAVLGLRTRYASSLVADADALRKRHREEAIAKAELTTRECAVLDLILLGRGHGDIAHVLGISERTSRFHLTNLLAKLGAESRHDLLRLFA
jgi:DNA-binding NarL/FixJ family response regulator